MPSRIRRGLSRKGRRSAGTVRTGIVGRRASRTVVTSSLRLLQLVDLAFELTDVAKLTIDRCEANVRDLIQLLQFLHQARANLLGRHLALGPLLQLGFDAIRDRFQLLDADRTFFRCGQQAGDKFLPLKRFAIPVLLHHTILDVLEPLAAGEPLATVEALAAAAYDIPFFALARVDYLITQVATIRALHRAPFSSSLSPTASAAPALSALMAPVAPVAPVAPMAPLAPLAPVAPVAIALAPPKVNPSRAMKTRPRTV